LDTLIARIAKRTVRGVWMNATMAALVDSPDFDVCCHLTWVMCWWSFELGGLRRTCVM
jgi:hypothetical protein